jgi:hypothetical protein
LPGLIIAIAVQQNGCGNVAFRRDAMKPSGLAAAEPNGRPWCSMMAWMTKNLATGSTATITGAPSWGEALKDRLPPKGQLPDRLAELLRELDEADRPRAGGPRTKPRPVLKNATTGPGDRAVRAEAHVAPRGR